MRNAERVEAAASRGGWQRAIVLATLFILAGLAAWFWYITRDRHLSEQPPRLANPDVLDPKESRLLVELEIPYSTISAALDQELDKLAGSRSDRIRIECIRNIGCIYADWKASYRRDGPTTIARSGEMISLTVPVSFDGWIGLTGALAKFFSLDHKKVDGSATVSAQFKLAMDSTFCPVIQLGESHFQWRREARADLIGSMQINVGRHFTGHIRHELAKWLATVRPSLPCEPLRRELARIWEPRAFELSIDGQPPGFLQVIPRAMGIASPGIDDDALRLRAFMKAEVSVASERPATPPATELPKNDAVEDGPGQLALALPVRLGYADLRERLLPLVTNQVFKASVPGGDASVRIRDVDIYPSGDRLAVQLDLSADLPGRPFDLSGSVWLLAQPEVDETGRKIALTRWAFSRQLDNDLAQALTALLEGPIRTRLQAASQIDLSKLEGEILAGIQAAIADPANTGGVAVRLDNAAISVGRIGLGPEALTVEINAGGQWRGRIVGETEVRTPPSS